MRHTLCALSIMKLTCWMSGGHKKGVDSVKEISLVDGWHTSEPFFPIRHTGKLNKGNSMTTLGPPTHTTLKYCHLGGGNYPECNVRLWHHDMCMLSTSLAPSDGNPTVTGGFPTQRDSNAELCVFFFVVTPTWCSTNTQAAGDLKRHNAHVTSGDEREPPHNEWEASHFTQAPLYTVRTSIKCHVHLAKWHWSI